MIKRLAYIMALVMGLSSATWAASLPISAGKDNRITTVQYDENNVVEIKAKPGVVTQIVLQKDEVYEAHAFGDGEAWHFNSYKNNLFLKPAKPLGTTNLSVITNKRDYMFKVNFVDEQTIDDDMFQVRFTYPDDDKKANEGKNIQQSFDNAKFRKVYNLNYMSKGSQTIAPINVYDDGNFTYFKFPGNVDLPVIYAVVPGKKSTGDEILVDKSVTGDGNNIIVMHKVNPWWRLRLGSEVLDIRSSSINWQGVLNQTGTIAPDVERIVKLQETGNE